MSLSASQMVSLALVFVVVIYAGYRQRKFAQLN
jgi:hypothetical protein